MKTIIKKLKNKDRGYLLEDIESVNGIIIPKNTKIKIINMLHVTAIIDILPYFNISTIKHPIKYRKIIKSGELFKEIKKI